MAHHKSAKTRITRNENARSVNISRKSRIRTFIKKVTTAITGGDKKTATENMRVAESQMARGAGRVMHKRTAARKTSRMAKKVNKMA